ncbi:MAG TPA: S8 family serine peptidase [Solirubrobacterales bacterium]|nr:S8 family serine peptidase [Solirubrobacterales bacterium]
MWRAALIIASLANIALVAASSRGSAQAQTAGVSGAEPSTTGPALVGVRTPPLPAVEAHDRRHRALDRARTRLAAVAERNGLAAEARSVPGGFLAVELGGRSLDRLRAELADDPLVTAVHPEYRAELRYAPNDPGLYARDPKAPNADFAQWNVLLTWAETAWGLARGSGGEAAVIDSGINSGHPDLAGRISGAINMCTEPPALEGCEGTGTGDEAGHGTHVAGLACAATDNGYGLASLGFGCSIYALKSDLTYTSIINSIYAAVAHGADAVNMSFGGGGASSELDAALDYAWANGAVPVAAGDNSPTPPPSSNYPAEYVQPEGSGPDVDSGQGLVVTSASHSGARSSFAQRTSGISVAAYGSATDAMSGGQQGIISTWPGPPAELDSEGVRTTVNGDNRFAYLVGTSMATPQVAGLVALMRSARPSIPAPGLVRLIKLTASGCGRYGSGGLGWGIIRSDLALAAAAQKDILAPNSRVRRAKRGRGRVAVLRLKRFDHRGEAPCTTEIPASGVKSVAVFTSANGGRFHRIAKTRKGKMRFRAKPRRYRFFSVAVDKAGNREAPPGQPDAKIRLRH